MTEARHHRFKPFLYLLLAGGGDTAERSAMEGVGGGNDFEPTLIMPVLAGQLEEALVGLGTAVAKEDFSTPDQLNQGRRQSTLRGLIVQIGNMDKTLGLLHQGGRDLRMCMTEGTHRDAPAQVEVASAIHVE